MHSKDTKAFYCQLHKATVEGVACGPGSLVVLGTLVYSNSRQALLLKDPLGPGSPRKKKKKPHWEPLQVAWCVNLVVASTASRSGLLIYSTS